jgi:hypothetical protein
MGINPYSKKWQRLSVIPGRLVENIVQATCRDLLAEHKLIMDKQGFNLVGSIHDEAIAEEHESIAHGRLDEMCQIMSTPLPLDRQFTFRRQKVWPKNVIGKCNGP